MGESRREDRHAKARDGRFDSSALEIMAGVTLFTILAAGARSQGIGIEELKKAVQKMHRLFDEQVGQSPGKVSAPDGVGLVEPLHDALDVAEIKGHGLGGRAEEVEADVELPCGRKSLRKVLS